MKRLLIDAAAWNRLAQAEDRPSYASAWLELLCRLIAGIELGVVVLRPSPAATTLRRLATWPDGAQPGDALQALANRAVDEGRGQAEVGEDGLYAAFPVVLDATVVGVVAVRAAADADEAERVLRELQWGAGWLVARLRADHGDAKVTEPVYDALRIVASAESFDGGCNALTTWLATVTTADRVSIGWRDDAFTRLVAVSHMAITPGRMNLIRSIEETMDEAIDQRAPLRDPGADAVPPRILTEHRRHRHEHDVSSLLTIPLDDVDGRVVGALCIERGRGAAFDAASAEPLERVASVVGPVLALRRRDERWIGAKAAAAARGQFVRIVGAGYAGRKAVLVALAAIVLFAAVATGEFRITADSRLEGAVLRTIAAPVDGFILDARVRAGDEVRAGDAMAQLDDRDLELERIALVSRRAQLALQLQEAMAQRERAAGTVLDAQVQQVDAQLALVAEQIRRMHIAAPFDGVVITGDLTQALGAAVSRGERLFQVAPLSDYRVIVLVDERDIDHVADGATGTLMLASLPGERFEVVVERVTPVAVAEAGANRFRVEARLVRTDPRMRPGMEGVAKLDAGERRLVWIWTRRLVDWARLTWWRYAP